VVVHAGFQLDAKESDNMAVKKAKKKKR